MRISVVCYILIIIILYCTSCKRAINPGNVDSISLIQVDHPYIGHRVDSTLLTKELIPDFIDDFANKKETVVKFYSCYVIKIRLKDGQLISYRTNGRAFEKFKDENTGAIYFLLNDTINLVTKYWGISEKQFCR